MSERYIKEDYMKVFDKDAHEFMCPYRSTIKKTPCIASGCMAWIRTVDEKGFPLYSGRCGMVQAFVPKYATFSVPIEDESTPEKSDE